MSSRVIYTLCIPLFVSVAVVANKLELSTSAAFVTVVDSAVVPGAIREYAFDRLASDTRFWARLTVTFESVPCLFGVECGVANGV